MEVESKFREEKLENFEEINSGMWRKIVLKNRDIFETVLKIFGVKFWQFWKHVVLKHLEGT